MKYSGKSIIIVAGGLLQVPAVKIAKSMGLQVIVTDKNPECACRWTADMFCQIDTKDIEGHIKLAKGMKNLAGIFVEGASVEMTAAAVAEKLGLPGISYDVARNIANKFAMRLELSKAEINPMQYAASCDYEDAKTRVERLVGYPFIVKAEDASGSRGATKCYKPEDFTQEVFDRAKKESSTGEVLIEELLQPDPGEEFVEQSVETVWYNEKGYWLNWVDRPFLDINKYAIELGHLNPAIHSVEKQKEVEKLVLSAGKALGMSTGIFKADVMLTDKGARILETTARLSGGFDAQYTSPMAHGVNYIRGAMKLALGEEIDWEDFIPKQYRHAVALSAFPKPGKVIRTPNLVAVNDILIFSRVKVGDIIPEYTTCVDRPLFVIADGDSRYEAVGKVKDALSKIQIETEEIK